MIERCKYSTIIEKVALQFGYDPDLIEAIVIKESSGNAFAARYEPAWKYFYSPSIFAKKLGITFVTEMNHQATSWGLMQVMGSVARELGYDSHLPGLVIPEVSLTYGIRQLVRVGRLFSGDDQIAAYNAGAPRKDANGRYVNQKYVDDVNINLSILKKLPKVTQA